MKKKIYILGVGILSTFFILVPILDIKVDAVTCIDVNAVFVRGSSQNLSNGKDPIDNLIDSK